MLCGAERRRNSSPQPRCRPINILQRISPGRSIKSVGKSNWVFGISKARCSIMRLRFAARRYSSVYQELWGLLLSYNIIRREAAFAAVAFGRSPSDIRFKPACQYIAVQLIVMANANPLSGTGRRLSELRSGMGSLFLQKAFEANNTPNGYRCQKPVIR